MRGVEKLVFIYELGNLVKSKYIILFPVLYLGLFLGFIGIFGAHEPFSFWFPLLYFFAAFAISGGLSRKVTISSPAIYYLSSYGRTRSYNLISVYLLVYIILTLFIFVADFASSELTLFSYCPLGGRRKCPLTSTFCFSCVFVRKHSGNSYRVGDG
ncbi:hypothetical protein IC007_2302 [Sulfuracidifex tepidarius]|uniref:Uncharacterized protein n=1 Tax=Sulfuracidifex tepidarius TaxID=1294262 RepID=A0A510E6T5_9CREN|nr:hypothetical protein IC007_2302 [Sulfuracidifex tepidarius]